MVPLSTSRRTEKQELLVLHQVINWSIAGTFSPFIYFCNFIHPSFFFILLSIIMSVLKFKFLKTRYALIIQEYDSLEYIICFLYVIVENRLMKGIDGKSNEFLLIYWSPKYLSNVKNYGPFSRFSLGINRASKGTKIRSKLE